MTYFPISPLEDPNLRQIVLYIANFLNDRFGTQSLDNPLIAPGQMIVKHTEIYDAFTVPSDSYPLLKIYRRNSRGQLDNSRRDSDITISYCLLNTQIRQTPAIANWIDLNIREAINQFKFDHPGIFEINNSISCRYRTVLQLGEIVYQVELDLSLDNESNSVCSPNPPC
jgi:hypothetical protein